MYDGANREQKMGIGLCASESDSLQTSEAPDDGAEDWPLQSRQGVSRVRFEALKAWLRGNIELVAPDGSSATFDSQGDEVFDNRGNVIGRLTFRDSDGDSQTRATSLSNFRSAIVDGRNQFYLPRGSTYAGLHIADSDFGNEHLSAHPCRIL